MQDHARFLTSLYKKRGTFPEDRAFEFRYFDICTHSNNLAPKKKKKTLFGPPEKNLDTKLDSSGIILNEEMRSTNCGLQQCS